jgi:Rab-GTPase-TBC domain
MTFTTIDDAQTPMPGSPPDLTGSKSSKSSSFHSSYQSDENDILADVNHFEDIGLDDDARVDREAVTFELKSPNPYTNSFANELLAAKRPRPHSRLPNSHNKVMHRELTSSKLKPAFLGPRGPVQNAEPQGLGLMPATTMSRRGLISPPTPTLSLVTRRNRSSSPNPNSLSNSRFGPGTSPRPRRLSWQANRERKTQKELEQECDEEDGDDVPDGCLLENVPISPRPIEERANSTPPSPVIAEKKEKTKNIGNGTPPVPVAQGSLRGPTSPAKPEAGHRGMSMGQYPISHEVFRLKARAKSWTVALSELSEEAKALTQALEAHSDEQKNSKQKRSRSTSSRPSTDKQRVRFAIAELPPLRRTDIMIDPLPISKEKEAVLSRTRPSWLPPKNPNEEKRHLKEYQRMMASSLEAERRKETERQARMVCRDDTASSLLRIWEEHVLPNWEAVTSLKRTRELWWRGVAPRSRGTVWQRAIGNELELTDASYHAALSRAKELEQRLARGVGTPEDRRKGGWFAAIRREIPGTYPELRIFQQDGPLCGPLVDVLMAYAMYRSDVGYMSGTNVSQISSYNL